MVSSLAGAAFTTPNVAQPDGSVGSSGAGGALGIDYWIQTKRPGLIYCHQWFTMVTITTW